MTKQKNRACMGRPNWSTLAVSAAMAGVLAGCGGERANLGTLYPVKGKVTLPDGKAPPKLSVIFSGPASNRVMTESDGTFAFKGDNAGLPAGKYQVRLEGPEAAGSSRKPVVPQKYLDEDASGLTATVTSDGPNDFDFKLTRDDATPQGSRGTGRRRP